MASSRQYQYDLVVIGGGSGGLAASKECTKVNPNAKVAVLDFVQPSHQGTKWGLGGTCVNVGCVPKKLMHHASLFGHSFPEAVEYGWEGADKLKHDWSKMSGTVTDYVRSLNFIYRVGLRGAGVDYIEGYGRFVDQHTLEWEGARGKKGTITSDKFLIATGGRPNLGTTPGRELCISSDDIFWMKKNPGKTLVIGAGYIALECAGFLHHIGNDVSVMVRGEFMRKFDSQSAGMIGELMERSGIRFVIPAQPLRFYKKKEDHFPAEDGKAPNEEGLVELPPTADGQHRFLHPSGAIETRNPQTKRSTWKIPPGKVVVEYKYNNDASGKTYTEEFDTVLLAIGRSACVEDLNLPSVNVKTYKGKVLVDPHEQTTAPNIYAIGDVAVGVPKFSDDEKYLAEYSAERPELTPVAIQAGLLLARRLFGKTKELMNYEMIPTTVFTPNEYGFVGLTQEQAERDLGKDNVEVYWSRYGNLETSPTHPHAPQLRSSAFLGKHLWHRRYAERNNLQWPEVSFDPDNNYAVLVTPKESKEAQVMKRPARVTGTYQDANGKWVYDLQYEDQEKEEEKAVESQRLELSPELQADNDELFLKATCLAKLICDKRQNNKVVGLHFIGPNAGEVLQGFALAVKLGCKKEDFDNLIGIHPTAAEEFAVLSVTKSEGKTFLKKAGCGGGTCG